MVNSIKISLFPVTSQPVGEVHDSYRVFKASLISGVDGYEYCESHDHSDLILVCNVWGSYDCRSTLDEVLASNICLANQDKVVVYNDFDNPIPNMVGAYTSLSSIGFSQVDAASVPYVNLPNHPFPNHVPNLIEREKLIYFAGSAGPKWSQGYSIRTKLAARFKSSGYLVGETNDRWSANNGISPDSSYVDNLISHRIVLCPRGVGNSSYRIYEAIIGGAVPLVLADDWIRPHFMNSLTVLQWSERALGLLGPYIKYALAEIQRHQCSISTARSHLLSEKNRCKLILDSICDIHRCTPRYQFPTVHKNYSKVVKLLKVVVATEIVVKSTTRLVIR